jgi:hypothetical protein
MIGGTFMSEQGYIDSLKQRIEELEAVVKFYAGDGNRRVNVNGKEYWIREYGCGCCAQSYEVDSDGSIGMMNAELEDVSGWTAREALANDRP